MSKDLFMNFPRFDMISSGLEPNLKEYFETYYEESKFGLEIIAEDLFRVPKHKRILEIGSGIGLLSHYLASKGYQVTSIEPAGQGFGIMTTLQKHVRNFFGVTNPELEIHCSTLEDFTPSRKFDYIFSINVFEHIENPGEGLIKTNVHLNEGGTARIITPNYGVPYEPHFHIPIIFNKETTYALFRLRILSFNCFDAIGLWQSLNWISIRKIQKLLRRESIPHVFSLEATRLYFGRLEGDNQFLARKGQYSKFIASNLKFLLRFLPLRLYPVLDLKVMKLSQFGSRDGNGYV